MNATCVRGQPISVLIASAISCLRASYTSASRASATRRTSIGARPHESEFCAATAAATARSTSSRLASGTTPTGSSVHGEMTVIVLSVAGATRWPPMNR